MQLPSCETLNLSIDNAILTIMLNRPAAKNAMSLVMVNELITVFKTLQASAEIRAVVLRGNEQNFCAGGDIKDMAAARQNTASTNDPIFSLNREFGRMLEIAQQLPQVVITVLEGAVLGGGFGLACISDIAIAHQDAQFGLPETSLGIPPAQIAPYVVQRIGLTATRRLALLGIRFNGEAAKSLGIVHEVAATNDMLEEKLQETIKQLKRCAPHANAITKQLLLDTASKITPELLDLAAKKFSEAVKGEEGTEGTLAFIQKRLPKWAN